MTNLSENTHYHHHHHDHDEDHDEDSNGVVFAKLISMLVLFSASMICGHLPILLNKYTKWLNSGNAGDLKSNNRVVVCLLSFGGGVLLSTTFIHLIPEVEENVEYLQAAGKIACLDFTLAPLLTCIGFFIMYLVEELIHLYIQHRENKSPLVRTLSIRKSQITSITESTADLIDPKTLEDQKKIQNNNHGHSHMTVLDDSGDDVIRALRGLLIVLALSIHELFEGLAVGLESSSGNVWYMLGAVSAHKLVIAFCIGVELIVARTKTSLAIVYITTFAVVSPLGIGTGILLVGGDGATAAGVYSVVLQGLASGTLLYVIFFEIWKNDKTGLLQYVSAVTGFCLMLGLKLIAGHSHNHNYPEGYDEDRCSHSSHSH